MSDTAVCDLTERTGVTNLFEKKTFLKIPAEMIMLRKDSGHISRLMYDVDITNYNIHGVCITWIYCPICFGYEANSIHKDCYFHQFDIKNPQSQKLYFNIEVPVLEELYTFKGKAVYTYKSKKGAIIGISFTDIPEKTRKYLEYFFNRK